jgi:hypothetical protein
MAHKAGSSTLVCQSLEGLLSPLGTSGRVHYTCTLLPPLCPPILNSLI